MPVASRAPAVGGDLRPVGGDLWRSPAPATSQPMNGRRALTPTITAAPVM